LLEFDAGMINFYYLLNDYPQEMEALINTIHKRELKAFEILAQGPCDVIILCENTSSFYISPEVYRKYNGPHVRDFVDIVHAAGKTAIIHMCGHVKNLLDQIKDTGLDGIHALTPPPTGDTPWELAMDVIGEDLIIIGVLDPTIFILGPVEEIASALDVLYTPRLRRANLILCPFADGIPVPLERFHAVADWMNRNSALT
jgi:uroporphyrinogen-III decarboxylase